MKTLVFNIASTRALGTRSEERRSSNAFLDFEERNGNAFYFSGQERGTERVHEISGTKLVSVPRSFLPMFFKQKLNVELIKIKKFREKDSFHVTLSLNFCP